MAQQKWGKGDFGHFHTNYKNIENLKLQFRDQLDKLLGQYD